MLDTKSLVLAGGIAEIDAKLPEDIRCGKLSGRSYQHPALPDRPVIRLAADVVAPGVDAEMETLGFEKFSVREDLGYQHYRSLGFPGWALVNDPKRAKFALEVMKDFKRAAAKVKSKPGHAKDAFVALADRLARAVPHFLPSFWEEAGRAFLQEDNKTFASQSFEKARQVEKQYKLAIDEDSRGASYLEFALAGAVSAKTLTAYGQELEKSYGAEKAYGLFRTLAVRRILGGMPPWAGLAKDLRALAKSSKLGLEAEDSAFLSEVVDAPALVRAPADFWTAYRPAFVRLGKESQAIRSRLRNLFPQPSGNTEKFQATWIDLLDESGALDALYSTTSTEEAKGVAASWFSKAIGYFEEKKKLHKVVERMAARLVQDDTKLQIDYGEWGSDVDLDLCELVLSLNIPITLKEKETTISLTQAFDCDPVLTAAHPVLGKFLREAVSEAMGDDDFENSAKGKKGLLQARHDWLMDRIRAGREGGLFDIESLLGDLEEKTNSAIFSEFPDAFEELKALRISGALGYALRGGLYDEFEWKVWQDAWEELKGKKSTVKVAGSYPYPILHNERKAIVLGLRERVFEHDFAIKADDSVEELHYLDGQLLVLFQDGRERKGYWSSRPKETFEHGGLSYHGSSLPLVTKHPDGGVVFGSHLVHAGDTKLERPGICLFDGTHYWVPGRDSDKVTYLEYDPKTGQKGRSSWPSVFKDQSELSDGFRISDLKLCPLPPGQTHSVLGDKDGLAGECTRTAEADDDNRSIFRTIDGRTWQFTGDDDLSEVEGLLRFPGDDAPRPLTQSEDWFEDEDCTVAQIYSPQGKQTDCVGGENGLTEGMAPVPPAILWHFMTIRDEKGSLALREVKEDLTDALLALAAKHPKDKVKEKKEMLAELRQLLPQIENETLAMGVARVAWQAGIAASRLDTFLKQMSGDGAVLPVSSAAEDDIDEDELSSATKLVEIESHWGSGSSGQELKKVSSFFETGALHKLENVRIRWEFWIGKAPALAFLLTNRVQPEDQAKALSSFLQVWASTVFGGDLARMRTITVEADASLDLAVRTNQTSSNTLLHEEGQSRYFVRWNDSDDDKVSLRLVEYSLDGEFRLPAGCSLKTELRHQQDPKWLGTFLQLWTEKGAVQWDDAALAELSKRSGLTQVESVMLTAAVPGFGDWATNFLKKEQREKLNIKMADAKVARETFEDLAKPKLLEILSSALPDDLRLLWTPTEGEENSFVATLARAWIKVVGQRVALRQELMVAVQKDLSLDLGTATVLAALLDPTSASFLKPGKSTFARAFGHDEAEDGPSAGAAFQDAVATDTAELIPYLFHSLPVGDEYRGKIPGFHAAVMKLLDDPELTLQLSTVWSGEEGPVADKNCKALLGLIAGKETVLTNGDGEKSAVAYDSGLVVGGIFVQASQAMVAFRPAFLKTEADLKLLEKITTIGQDDTDLVSSIVRLKSDGMRAMIERIQTTPVPADAWEYNPLHSVPNLVKTVAFKHKLSEKAAMLYLQMLAVRDPTIKNVQLWNGWKPADYKAASAELVSKKLVTEGKRERAGREIFLAGVWEKGRRGTLPTEGWKKPFYKDPMGDDELQFPLKPIHEVFEAAWKRIEAGDVPAFEEV